MKVMEPHLTNFDKCLAIFVFTLGTTGQALASCGDESLLDQVCMRLVDTWTQGDNDFYLPFHAHHLRFAYTKQKIESFRENNWGIGYGRSRYNEYGNWDGLYGMTFLDSHSSPEYIFGYAHEWMWGEPEALHAGLGYTALVTGRKDIAFYAPIPLVLPVASVNYDKVSVNATYVPGGKGNGNVIFFWSRISF
jgi:lipid IVA palmitoyltransferase